MKRCDAYRHFAEECVVLAHTMESPRDRSILLDMALVWSRPEYAAKRAADKLPAESE